MSPLPASAAQQSRLTVWRFPGRGFFHLKKTKREMFELADFFPTAKAVPTRSSLKSKPVACPESPHPARALPCTPQDLQRRPHTAPRGWLGVAPSAPCCCSGCSSSVCSSSAWNRGLLRGRNRHSPWPRLATPPPRRCLGLVSCHTLLVPGREASPSGPGPRPLSARCLSAPGWTQEHGDPMTGSTLS